jgi:hypothetical protein
MTVTAKFYVAGREERSLGANCASESVTVTLWPIYDGNADWSKQTPDGDIKMRITNRGASDQFIPGRVFSITFEADDRPQEA